ncbi:hypothetical protein WL29_22940 [Burkholderia ubonensis]|uniref:Uncharacterized protein n=1 Tax=Burkholderia ubonensis TaxID=101571 RepID=A0A106QC22_9BURK|nr:PAS domain-containing protein [Burkholderia ubonensis]KWA84220.1 hypothetical protein WL29_22940 [Burkholderia ubonensis]
MLKNSLSLQLAVFLAVVAAVTGALSFVYSEAIPYLHNEFPSIRRVHDERPYVINSLLSFASLLLSFFTFVRFTAFKRGLKSGFGDFSQLNDVITYAEFSSDSGVFYLDENLKVLSASQLALRLTSAEAAADILGKRCDEVFSEKFCRLLEELEDKATTTRRPAAVEISDWSPYCSNTMGPIKVIATPSYLDGRFLGFAIVLRSKTELRLAEESAILHQQNYQVLFDSLQIGVAVFRPAVASDGGPDGYVTEANASFRRLFEGLPLPYTEPASVVWPSFVEQDRLREGVSQVLAGASSFRCELFSPLVGKHFEVELVPMPAGRVLAMVTDQTDVRIHEQQVLALNDQLQRNLAQQREYLHCVLDDITHFHEAAADVVEAQLDRVCQVAPNIPGAASGVSEACSELYRVQNQVGRYHAAITLPYRENSLVYPAEVVTRLLEALSNRYPNIVFNLGSLPAVVASHEVLASIIEQLMVSLANLPVAGEAAARIEVGGQGDFLSTGIYVAAWGLDFTPLFIEIPETAQPLDWTMTSDLDLAVVRRMVTEHGGSLSLGPTEDRRGAKLIFTVGAPT